MKRVHQTEMVQVAVWVRGYCGLQSTAEAMDDIVTLRGIGARMLSIWKMDIYFPSYFPGTPLVTRYAPSHLVRP